MILRANEQREAHPDGIFPAVCVDVIDLGMVEGEWQGEKRVVRKVRLVFETQMAGEEPRHLSRTFTASLSPKSKLAEVLGAWRGRSVGPGETIDLDRLVGVSATLVVSHTAGRDGTKWAGIDAVSRPTSKLTPSGKYNGAEARQRLREKGYKLGEDQKVGEKAPEIEATGVDVAF